MVVIIAYDAGLEYRECLAAPQKLASSLCSHLPWCTANSSCSSPKISYVAYRRFDVYSFELLLRCEFDVVHSGGNPINWYIYFMSTSLAAVGYAFFDELLRSLQCNLDTGPYIFAHKNGAVSSQALTAGYLRSSKSMRATAEIGPISIR